MNPYETSRNINFCRRRRSSCCSSAARACGSDELPLKKCAGCGAVAYCGTKKCQVAHSCISSHEPTLRHEPLAFQSAQTNRELACDCIRSRQLVRKASCEQREIKDREIENCSCLNTDGDHTRYRSNKITSPRISTKDEEKGTSHVVFASGTAAGAVLCHVQ